MQLKIKVKKLNKNPKREFFCDKCGASSLNKKMRRRKTFTHGKHSKPTYYNECMHGCKKSIKFMVTFL